MAFYPKRELFIAMRRFILSSFKFNGGYIRPCNRYIWSLSCIKFLIWVILLHANLTVLKQPLDFRWVLTLIWKGYHLVFRPVYRFNFEILFPTSLTALLGFGYNLFAPALWNVYVLQCLVTLTIERLHYVSRRAENDYANFSIFDP